MPTSSQPDAGNSKATSSLIRNQFLATYKVHKHISGACLVYLVVQLMGLTYPIIRIQHAHAIRMVST